MSTELIHFFIKFLYKHYFVVPKNNSENVCDRSIKLHISNSLEKCQLNKNLLKAYEEIIILI